MSEWLTQVGCRIRERKNKPLFVPLKAEYYEAFENGTKDTEHRKYGRNWTERTVRQGRRVILSYGYSKGRRMTGIITAVKIHQMDTPEFIACYGEAAKAISFTIELDEKK